MRWLLDRLVGAKSSSGYFSGLNLGWAYDAYGNRESQTASGSTGVALTQPESLTYQGNNNHADQFAYDADGDVVTDLTNNYKYDAEGRVCAVDNDVTGVTLYLYNAEGQRVAKGTGSFSCNLSSNGFAPTNLYILDLAGRPMTELDGSGHWMHTNVYANGRLLATYGANETFFSLQDWQGTKRVQTTSNGEVDLTYASLPYGDNLTVSGSGPNATDQFFTGKERDQESGNDYFGARYYSSLTGRFLSPDWSAKVEPVPYARLSDPQSMNLYTYVENSPMDREDADGHVQNSGTENNWGSLAQYIDNSSVWGGLNAWQKTAKGSNPLDGLSNISTATQLALIQTLTQISSAFAQPAQAQQQGLSSKSDKAIDKAANKYGYDASTFKNAMTQAGNKYKLDPNLLVGLGMRESSLNPFAMNGGLFQIQDPTSYGLSTSDIYRFQAQIPAAAKVLSGEIQSFGGNVDLGIASWTLGVGETRHLFTSGGMNSVRSAWLDRNHHDYGQVGPNYIDVIQAFAH